MLKRPLVLLILDGFGIAPDGEGNAVAKASLPNFRKLVMSYPSATLQAAGEAVGLPWQNMGNSEVGHLNLGSGRIMYQELPKINKAIKEGLFFQNKAFKKAITKVKSARSQLHLIGLLSQSGVHAHVKHLEALLELAVREKVKKVYLHLFLDGRDSPKDSAKDYLPDLQKKIKVYKVGRIAVLCGRFYAMDRDERFERVLGAYEAMVSGKGHKAADPYKAILDSYQKKIYDEEFRPTIICENGRPITKISDNDALIFFNFRADRAKEITAAFSLPDFTGFKRKIFPKNLTVVTMCPYAENLPVEIAFPRERVANTLGEAVSKSKIRQLRLAETEKYAHVTAFFNGNYLRPFWGEDRKLVHSPHVESYDQKPEMSVRQVTAEFLKSWAEKKYGFWVINFANADMVGHTGNFKATLDSLKALDLALGKIYRQVAADAGILVITADHGNAEVMVNPENGDIDKEHSANPVPFVLVDEERLKKSDSKVTRRDLASIAPIGVLADVAPTILELLQIKKPSEMTGISLLSTIG